MKQSRCFFTILLLALSLQVLGAQTGPGGVGRNDGSSSLKMWLKADAGVSTSAGAVTSWNDRTDGGASANGNISIGTFPAVISPLISLDSPAQVCSDWAKRSTSSYQFCN